MSGSVVLDGPYLWVLLGSVHFILYGDCYLDTCLDWWLKKKIRYIRIGAHAKLPIAVRFISLYCGLDKIFNLGNPSEI